MYLLNTQRRTAFRKTTAMDANDFGQKVMQVILRKNIMRLIFESLISRSDSILAVPFSAFTLAPVKLLYLVAVTGFRSANGLRIHSKFCSRRIELILCCSERLHEVFLKSSTMSSNRLL